MFKPYSNVALYNLPDTAFTSGCVTDVNGFFHIENSGKLEAFGLGTPLIYINDKKVMDFSEVERLTVKDIKNIKFISNPGAEYDASGKAIILITVHNPQDGLKFQLKTRELKTTPIK